MKPMTVNVPFTAIPQEIEGGGYWAEIKEIPGCVAQANTLEELERNLAQAVIDWLQEAPVKTLGEAVQLAALQGGTFVPPGDLPETLSLHATE